MMMIRDHAKRVWRPAPLEYAVDANPRHPASAGGLATNSATARARYHERVSKTRDAIVASTIIALILSGWAIENRPRASRAADLRDLLASPACVADGPRGPTVAKAWARTFRLPIARASPNFIGSDTIELGLQGASSLGQLTFIRAGGHVWRPNHDSATDDWLATACARLH